MTVNIFSFDSFLLLKSKLLLNIININIVIKIYFGVVPFQYLKSAY